MFEEEFIANKLRKFSLIDICLVSIVYFLVGPTSDKAFLAIKR